MIDNTPFVADAMLEEITVGIIIVAVVIGLIFATVFYIFQAIGLYNISKKRGYQKAWIAFIPIVNNFVLGAVTDNINACVKKRTYYRYILLILSVLLLISTCFMIPTQIDFMRKSFELSSNPEMAFGMMSGYLGVMGIVSLIGLANKVFLFIALYRIYVDYDPNNSIMFLILSIFFQITIPFFLFAIRNKPSVSIYYATQAQQAQQQYQQFNQGSNTYDQA